MAAAEQQAAAAGQGAHEEAVAPIPIRMRNLLRRSDASGELGEPGSMSAIASSSHSDCTCFGACGHMRLSVMEGLRGTSIVEHLWRT